MKKPIIAINFKTYDAGTGKKALKLAKIIDEVSQENRTRIILCAQTADIYRIASETKSPIIFGQNFDVITYGAHTGHILPESLKAAGARGVVLNHAENKVDHKVLRKSIKLAKSVGLKVIACADTVDEVRVVARMHPDYLAVEPPELIGGNISISKAKPQIITDTVKHVKKIDSNIKVLVGAGIKSAYDVGESMMLGADGVFVASGVVCSNNPKKIVSDMVNAR